MESFHTFKTYDSFVEDIKKYPNGIIIGTNTLDLENKIIYTIIEHMNKESNMIFSNNKNEYIFEQSDLIVDYKYETNFKDVINPVTNSKINGSLEEELFFLLTTHDINKKLISLENKFKDINVYFQDNGEFYFLSEINNVLKREIGKNKEYLEYT